VEQAAVALALCVIESTNQPERLSPILMVQSRLRMEAMESHA
jgi:hypothetical protein